jgi:hypothetical protein
MRKLFFLFAILGIAGLVACGGETATEEPQDDAAAQAAALQESTNAFVEEVNAYKVELDNQIAAATDEAQKAALTETRMKLDQMGSTTPATMEELDAMKASFAEIKGMQSGEAAPAEGAEGEATQQ